MIPRILFTPGRAPLPSLTWAARVTILPGIAAAESSAVNESHHCGGAQKFHLAGMSLCAVEANIGKNQFGFVFTGIATTAAHATGIRVTIVVVD